MLDTSFLIYIANKPLPDSDYVSEIQPYNLITIDDVVKELIGISHDPKIKRSKEGLCALNYIKDIPKEYVPEFDNTDDKIVACASKNNRIIASLDRNIIRKAILSHIDYITIEKTRLIWTINLTKS